MFIIAKSLTKSNENLIAAIAYAKRLNWAVFPLVPNSKIPHTENGFKDATTDEEIIKQYWFKWPDAGVGIPTGQVNGFFVLDVDTKNNGHETLEEMMKYYEYLPDTVQAITGSKGSHYLFKYHEGIGNKTEMLPGLDIRGDGGYIVVSPSIHENGNKYEWELMSHPLDTEIAEAPQWLLNMVEQPVSNEYTENRSSSHWDEIMNGVSEGGRNQAAASLAGHLLRHYVNPNLAYEIVHLWNTRNSPSLSRDELDKVINSIANKELKRRKGR